jgi:hypothetical protein
MGASGSDPGPLGIVVGIALIINVIGLFFFTGVALLTLGFIGVTWALCAKTLSDETQSQDFGIAMLVLCWVAALFTGASVGAFHWWDFKWPALVAVGLYALAVLGLARGLGILRLLLSLLLSAAMIYAVLMLPPPPGSLDEEKEENWTRVEITVTDEAGNPLEGATVLVEAKWFWQNDTPEQELGLWGKRETDAKGAADSRIKEDARLKTVVVRVERPPLGDRPGYQPAKQERLVTSDRETLHFKFQLKK